MTDLQYCLNDVAMLGSVLVGIAMLTWPARVPERFFALTPIRWFGFGFLVFSVAAPLYLRLSDHSITGEPAFTGMLLMGLVAGSTYLVGWRSAARRLAFKGFLQVPATYPMHSLVKVALFTAMLGIVATTVLAILAGGGVALLQVRESALGMTGIDWYNTLCFFTAQYVVALGIVSHLVVHTRHKLLLSGILVVLAFLFLLTSLKLGSRTRLFYGVFNCVYLLNFANSRRRTIALMAFCILALPIAVRFGQVRGSRLSVTEQALELSRPSGTTGDAKGLYSILGSAEFDAFENGVHLVDIVGRKGGYLYGASFLAALINPIPRLIWPTKPVVDVVAPMREAGVGKAAYDNANIAVSLVAECYVNLGWWGVLLFPYVLGYLTSRAWSTLIPHADNLIVALSLTSLCVFSLMVCRGSFVIMSTIALMASALPLLGLLRYALLRSKVARAA